MTAGGSTETIGENKEFTVVSISDVTVYFNGGSTGTNTSANDTETAKYFDTQGLVKAFTFRPNQTIQIVSMNGVTLTNPISIFINTVYTEKFDVSTVFKLVVRTTVANTHIRLRVRGR